MTREEKLIAVNGAALIQIADKLGVKVACDKSRRSLKEAKANVVKRILEAEAKRDQAKEAVFTTNPITEIEYYHGFQNNTSEAATETAAEAPQEPITEPEDVKVVETIPTEKKALKKANLKLTELTYKGETKSIKEWAAEINMPWPTLYDRVNRNG